MSEDAQLIVRGMIKLIPLERLTIPQILAHHWLKETNEDDSEEDEEEKGAVDDSAVGSRSHIQ